MKIGLDAFSLSKQVFLQKVGNDLEFGVRVKTGAKDDRDVVRVWTDSRDWQFSLVGLVQQDHSISVEKIEIQSFGESKRYLKLDVQVLTAELDIDIQKLSPNFAELSAVTVDEAQDFIEGYMNSTVNRTLTERLFEDYAKDKDQYSWLQF